MKTTQKKMRRRAERGAAMLEGIVVITTMLVFLGMIVFAGKAYGAKIDQAAQVRSDVLYYASHGCGELPENASATSTGGDEGAAVTPDAETSEATSRAAKIGGNETSALERKWNMATSSAERTVDGEAIVDLKKVAISTRVKTDSWVACNEKTYGDMWTGLVDFGVDWVKSGAGVF